MEDQAFRVFGYERIFCPCFRSLWNKITYIIKTLAHVRRLKTYILVYSSDFFLYLTVLFHLCKGTNEQSPNLLISTVFLSCIIHHNQRQPCTAKPFILLSVSSLYPPVIQFILSHAATITPPCSSPNIPKLQSILPYPSWSTISPCFLHFWCLKY